MEQTLRALAEILQKASITILLVVILFWYLKAMLYGPLEKILKQRAALTEGTRKSAAESLAAADRKTAEYEAKIREARAELYKEQEDLRRKWLEEQTAQIAAAQDRSAKQAQTAKAQITNEAAAARQNLDAAVGALADQIANTVLAPGRQA
ncbi:MAG: ATP synthase F0 subunit B [Bryobacteraceae bacterium]